MMPYRSASFELDTAIIAHPVAEPRDLRGHPVRQPVRGADAGRLVDQATAGPGRGRATTLHAVHSVKLLLANRNAFGEQELADGNYTFERVGYLLADRAQRAVGALEDDRPGSLRELLNVFEQHRISLASIHSSSHARGRVHFRIGFVAGSDPTAIRRAAAEVGAGLNTFIHRWWMDSEQTCG